MIAHIAGVPVEETLLPLMSGMGPAVMLVGAWVMAYLRRRSGSDGGDQHCGIGHREGAAESVDGPADLGEQVLA